jgi:hypothetical protein
MHRKRWVIGLRSDIVRGTVEDSTVVEPVFVGCHEVGHLCQLLSGQTEGALYTLTLLRQELDACRFGSALLRTANAGWFGRRFRWHWYHWVLALESTLPFLIHAVVLVPVTYLAGMLAYLVGDILKFMWWESGFKVEKGGLADEASP